MDRLLKKISDAGLDPSSVSGEEAITFWEHIRQHIAVSPQEKARCYLISAEYRNKFRQNQLSIDELKNALALLNLPDDAEDIITIKNNLCDRLVEHGHYSDALQEYIEISTLAVKYSSIDDYALAVLGMGNLCDAYGDHARALRYYQKIDSIDHALSSRTLRLRYKLYMVACLTYLNRISAAESLLKECDELSILVSDKVLTGQVILYTVQILRRKKQYMQALHTLANAHLSIGGIRASWLSNMLRLEQVLCLSKIGKIELASMLLASTTNRIQQNASPVLLKKLYDTLSYIFTQQKAFAQALTYEKKSYRIEADLIKSIPISDLGSFQLRRLARFELQLKLIMSEQENRELKETTENQKNAVAQLQQDVFTDPLTQLHNRRWLEVKLKDLLLHETPFAFLVIDIDHFKSINDELSHLVGDKVIVNVAQELKNQFKFKGASCVRFGGEEFLIIVEDSTLERAEMLAEQLRERIFQFRWYDILGERGLTISIGVTLHKSGENTQRTFYRADKALYRAKANGRNQVCCE
ncbi:GGDEF domain-containing protein [Vibrio albus]|uniref:diguanylate cyclase n=1 Tax=Vibrio albus TaxID=2200953 RepID=A0A2U3B764_9VIBR|nr:GGDEF domain-containing protein [Vibrio albus]PWI32646.1 GGDEF domain-containing protein [Vibrio albus]